MSLLSNITPDQVIADPFPHVVIENAIDEDLCEQLVREFPPLETFTQGKRVGSNQKIIYTGAMALQDPELSVGWKAFIQENLQPSIWEDTLRLFRPYLLGEYPEFENRFGKLDEFTVGTRYIDDFSRCDVLLDSELVIQTPVVGPPCVERGPHLKQRDKPFVGYLYLRPDEDDADGADHVLYSIKPGARLLFDKVQAVDPKLLIVRKVIPYRRNTFIGFLNSSHAIQGLTARSSSNLPVMMHHIVTEVRDPLFEIEVEPSVGKSSFLRTLACRSGLRRTVHEARKLVPGLKARS